MSEVDNAMESWLTDQSLAFPLVAEYDKHLEEMNEQLKYCQMQMKEMRIKLEQVIKENERLHEELKEAVEKQLETLPSGSASGDGAYIEENILRNLQEQLQLANKEKEHVLELWQTVSLELEQLQQKYQKCMTEAQIHIVEGQKHKDQLTSFQQLTRQLHLANEKMESMNQVFMKTVREQNAELEQLRKQQRQSKSNLRTAVSKADEMTRVTEALQEQMAKKEEDAVAAREREEASDKRLQQLQSCIKQLETRLCLITKESVRLKAERATLEKQIQDLQKKCSDLEEAKYNAVENVRESLQLLEEANLQASQAMIAQKQKEEEIENMKEAFSQLLQDSALITRKEVEKERKRHNIQISRLTEELTALQMECGEKQSQIERAIRERRAVEEELEKINVCQVIDYVKQMEELLCRCLMEEKQEILCKSINQVYHEGRGNEGDYRKVEELHQRCLIAERTKDDLQLSLQKAQNKIKQQEMNYEEEIGRCQEMIHSLQSILDSSRQNCSSISEECLKLQQENEQFKKEMEDLKRLASEAQKTAKLKINTMKNEHLIKEHGFEVQLKEMEDVNQSTIAELRCLLIAQQKATNRWKEETKKLTEITEAKMNNLKSELHRQKNHAQELLCQLERANAKVTENEKLMLEHQEKVNRLQSRLSQAEERAAAAIQQLNVLTMQKKKAASLLELEHI